MSRRESGRVFQVKPIACLAFLEGEGSSLKELGPAEGEWHGIKLERSLHGKSYKHCIGTSLPQEEKIWENSGRIVIWAF